MTRTARLSAIFDSEMDAAPCCGRRFELSRVLGKHTAINQYDDLSAAQARLDAFKKVNRGNKDAQGGIYDRETRIYVDSWTGAPKRYPLIGPWDIYAKLIALGKPVSIIGPHGSADFNDQPKCRERAAR